MKVYVVIGSYGDYTGWFEHCCFGAYLDKAEAEQSLPAAKESIRELGWQSKVEVSEQQLRFGNDPNFTPCETCNGKAESGHFACPQCGCAGWGGAKQQRG